MHPAAKHSIRKKPQSPLAILRGRADISARELAHAVDCDPSMITLIERTPRGAKPSATLARRIAAVLIGRAPEITQQANEWVMSLGFLPPVLCEMTAAKRRKFIQTVIESVR